MWENNHRFTENQQHKQIVMFFFVQETNMKSAACAPISMMQHINMGGIETI